MKRGWKRETLLDYKVVSTTPRCTCIMMPQGRGRWYHYSPLSYPLFLTTQIEVSTKLP